MQLAVWDIFVDVYKYRQQSSAIPWLCNSNTCTTIKSLNTEGMCIYAVSQKKLDQQYFLQYFDKFKCIVVIFGKQQSNVKLD